MIAAVVQMTSTSDADGNLAAAEHWIAHAASAGATFVGTPENTDFLGPHAEKVARAQTLDGPLCRRLGALAASLRIHLLLGSMAEKSDEATRCFNTSVLFGPDGRIVASYRKIHLFDVDVSADVRFQESATVVAGDEPVVAGIPAAKIGLSVCYDLRFPELYRALVDRGAQVLTVPAAFTATTGKDHWEVLLRARAIETQCYVLAPAQTGRHDDGGLRHSHGHAMIIDPWGLVIARCSDGPGVALAEIDIARVERVRQGIPLASHRRIGCG